MRVYETFYLPVFFLKSGHSINLYVATLLTYDPLNVATLLNLPAGWRTGPKMAFLEVNPGRSDAIPTSCVGVHPPSATTALSPSFWAHSGPFHHHPQNTLKYSFLSFRATYDKTIMLRVSSLGWWYNSYLLLIGFGQWQWCKHVLVLLRASRCFILFNQLPCFLCIFASFGRVCLMFCRAWCRLVDCLALWVAESMSY